MRIENWKTQLRKGYLEFYLLVLLERRKMYGAAILDAMTAIGLPLTDGTLYALLGRLSRENVISGEWVTEQNLRHPRKYYCLTEKGKTLLTDMKQEWRLVNKAIGQEMEDDHGGNKNIGQN